MNPEETADGRVARFIDFSAIESHTEIKIFSY